MVLMGSPCPQVPPGAAEEAPGPRGTVKQQGSTDGNLHRGVWSPQTPPQPPGLEGGREAQAHGEVLAEVDRRTDRGRDVG